MFHLHRATVHDLLVSMGRMTGEVQIRRVKLIPEIFWSFDTCPLPVFCCMWKQSACESKNFTCGEKEICIPDYHRKNFKCKRKCDLGYTGAPCSKSSGHRLGFIRLKNNITQRQYGWRKLRKLLMIPSGSYAAGNSINSQQILSQ